MKTKLLITILTCLAITHNASAMDDAREWAKRATETLLGATEAPDGSMQIDERGFRAIQIIGSVMLSSGIFGQAIKAFEHDTGLKLSSWAPLKHTEAILGSILIGYLASDLADDGKVNSPISSIQDSNKHITWKSLLGFFTKKALWTVPAYIGWIGVDHIVKPHETTERK